MLYSHLSWEQSGKVSPQSWSLRLAFSLGKFPSSTKEKGEKFMATNLFVGNLSYSIDSDKLGQLFAQAGTVASAKVISDKYSGRSRGFGFVEMASDAEVKKAIEMFNGKEVDGRALVVNEARPPKPRE